MADRSESILRAAFYEYLDERFESGIYRDDEFETSEKFNKRMKKLIKSEHNVYHRLTLTRGRKVACVLIAILIILLSMLSVGAVRDAVANFFVEHFSDHNHLTTVIEEDDSSPTTLEEVYELSYVPEGYVLKQENIYEEKATYIYINGRKDITFSQITRDYYSASIDNKDVDISVEKHDGQDYLVYGIEDGSFIIIYDNGRYVFSLSSYELPKETMIKMLETIKVR